MSNQRGFTLIKVFHLVIILLVVAGAGGWIWNIVKIVGSDFGQITAMLVLRCIGIVIGPLGAVLGFV